MAHQTRRSHYNTCHVNNSSGKDVEKICMYNSIYFLEFMWGNLNGTVKRFLNIVVWKSDLFLIAYSHCYVCKTLQCWWWRHIVSRRDFPFLFRFNIFFVVACPNLLHFIPFELLRTLSLISLLLDFFMSQPFHS